MVFWNRDQDPPELRGKKPEEIVEALRKLQEFETKTKEYETTKADLETKLTSQQGEYDQVKARLQELEQSAAQQQAQPYMQPQQPVEPTSPWTDPEKWVSERLAPTQVATLLSLRNSARLNFENGLSPRDRRIFKKYEAEVDRAMQGYGLNYQGDPQYWNVALKLIKGEHEQDLAKLDSSDSPFFSEPAGRGAPPEAPPEEKLTREEEEVCRVFHFDPDGYLKRKKERIMLQGEKGAYARYPVPTTTRTRT